MRFHGVNTVFGDAQFFSADELGSTEHFFQNPHNQHTKRLLDQILYT